MISIFCSDNSDLAEFEASSKGYRSDIIVKTASGAFYQLHVYDIVRLKQDFDAELEAYGFFGIEPNLILVEEVVLSNIKVTVERLWAQKYFDQIKPIDKNELDIKELIEV